jgi:hypothetical protein
MAKFLSDRSAQRLGPALDAIESLAPRKNNAPRRRIRSVGGGSVRQWVKITSVTSPSEYIGDLYDFPDGSATQTGIKISVYGASSNEYNVGYAAFADKSTDSAGEDVYYIDGYLLG